MAARHLQTRMKARDSAKKGIYILAFDVKAFNERKSSVCAKLLKWNNVARMGSREAESQQLFASERRCVDPDKASLVFAGHL